MEEAMAIIIPELLGILAIVLIIVIPIKRKKAQRQKEAEEQQQRALWQAKQQAEQQAKQQKEQAIAEKFRNNELVQMGIKSTVTSLYNRFVAKMPPIIHSQARGDYDEKVIASWTEEEIITLCSTSSIGGVDLHSSGYPQLSPEECRIVGNVMFEAVKPQITEKINAYFRARYFGNDKNVTVKINVSPWTRVHYCAKLSIEYSADNGNFKGMKSW